MYLSSMRPDLRIFERSARETLVRKYLIAVAKNKKNIENDCLELGEIGLIGRK